MNGKHTWRRQSVLWLALLSFLICVLAIRPWTRAGSAPAVPLAPMSVKHTALGDVRVYNRAAALALPGVQVQRVKVTPFYSKTQASAYAAAHQDVAGSHSLTVGAELVLLYWFGNFLCGFGVATSSTDPIWAYTDEVGFLYVDGTVIDGTASGGFASTADETGCDNPGAPGGAYWKMLTEAGGTWFDGTVIDGSAATYQIQ